MIYPPTRYYRNWRDNTWNIDIGETMRLLNRAKQQPAGEIRAAYQAMPAGPPDCTECDACTERCPFGVDVVSKMKNAIALFSRE